MCSGNSRVCRCLQPPLSGRRFRAPHQPQRARPSALTRKEIDKLVDRMAQGLRRQGPCLHAPRRRTARPPPMRKFLSPEEEAAHPQARRARRPGDVLLLVADATKTAPSCADSLGALRLATWPISAASSTRSTRVKPCLLGITDFPIFEYSARRGAALGRHAPSLHHAPRRRTSTKLATRPRQLCARWPTTWCSTAAKLGGGSLRINDSAVAGDRMLEGARLHARGARSGTASAS